MIANTQEINGLTEQLLIEYFLERDYELGLGSPLRVRMSGGE
jgi:hypothetical protein